MKYTEDNVMVLPLNEAKLLRLVERSCKFMKKENEEFRIRPDGLVEDMANVHIDHDCCYGHIDKMYFQCGVEHVYLMPVFINVITPEGRTCPIYPSFYLPVTTAILRKSYSKPAVSLREYMRERYNYNPRIIKNMKEFLSSIID